MTHITSVIVALKTITLLLGGLITYFAYKAYLRTESSSLRALSIGFGVITLGSLLAGVADQFTAVQPASVLVIDSLLTALGFAVITYSLYVE